MTASNLRQHPPTVPATQANIPADQARALDRRLALDRQQRGFRNAVPRPHLLRPRPPG